MTSFLKGIDSRIILASLVFVLCGAALGSVHKLHTFSYAKTHPYEIAISLKGQADNHVFFAYDYGQGIIDQNVRRLELTEANQSFNFSVSAWKHVHAIYVFAPQKLPFTISSLNLIRKGSRLELNISETGPTLEGENWFYRFPLADFEY